MPAVDFGAWATPNLELLVGGVTYTVTPPTVQGMKQILAAAVRGEVNLGLVAGPVPDEIQAVVDTIGEAHPALGDGAYWQMVTDNVPKTTIDRVAYYATFYWARGKEYADWLATVLFMPRDVEADLPAPKARPRSPRKSGRGTA